MTTCTWYESDEEVKTCVCPYCNTVVSAKEHYCIIEEKMIRTDKGMNKPEKYVLECPKCGNPIILTDDNRTYPPAKLFDNILHLPEDVSKLYDESRLTYSSGCYTASIMVARTIIMYIGVDKGADAGKSFQYYVDYLFDKQYIPLNSKGWVDKIRLLGNGAVHKIEIRTEDEATMVIKFLMYLLKIIYELPNELTISK